MKIKEKGNRAIALQAMCNQMAVAKLYSDRKCVFSPISSPETLKVW